MKVAFADLTNSPLTSPAKSAKPEEDTAEIVKHFEEAARQNLLKFEEEAEQNL